MKLLQKTNLYYILLSSIIFIIAGVSLYFILKVIIANELDEKLLSNKEEVTLQIKNGDPLIKFSPYVEVQELPLNSRPFFEIRDTLIMDPVEQEAEPFRQLVSVEAIHGKSYRIITRSSTIESRDYLTAIALSSGVVLLLLLLGILFINYQVSRRIWAVFKDNLGIVSNFSLKKDDPLSLIPSDIDEFRELNRVMETMAAKAQKDYQSLKEFTENASHELQTPLAIIRSNLELLVQQPTLTEEEAVLIDKMNTALAKMVSLNRGLLLLAKIDNQQFDSSREIDMTVLLNQQLEVLSDSIEMKGLHLETSVEKDVLARGNPELTGIMLSNLFDNAIRHNLPHGRISISLKPHELIVSNTGSPPGTDPEELFQRFRKSGGSSGSLGLGLAISRHICTYSGWKLSYTYLDGTHSLVLTF